MEPRRPSLSRLPWPWIARVSIVVSAVGFVFALIDLADGDWSRVATTITHNAWLPLLVVIVSFMARVLRWPSVVAAFLGGFFTSMWMAHTVGSRTADWLGPNDVWQLVLAVPAAEEIAKLVPVVVVVLAWRWERRGSVSATDLAVLGMASGAGFAVHEDSLWLRVSGSGLDTPLGWLIPSAHNGSGVAAGHVGWTGLVGLAIGIWFVNRSRRWTRILPVLALALVIADHGFWNDRYMREVWRPYLLDGWAVIGLLLMGVVVAVVTETRLVHRSTDGRTTAMALRIPRLLLRARSPWNLVVRAHLLVGLVRETASRAHQLATLQRGSPLGTESGDGPAAPTAEVLS